MKFFNTTFIFLIGLFFILGCQRRQAMYDQPKIQPWEPSEFFDDGRGVRPPIPGTIPFGYLKENEHLYKGIQNGKLATTFPMPVTKELLQRGQERYVIHCSPCHALTGNGDGMIVQRGFYKPPSYHIDRLRTAPYGHFFNVISNGIGNMNGYGPYIAVEDRWAIVAYIRALQRSEHASLNDVSNEEKDELTKNSIVPSEKLKEKEEHE